MSKDKDKRFHQVVRWFVPELPNQQTMLTEGKRVLHSLGELISDNDDDDSAPVSFVISMTAEGDTSGMNPEFTYSAVYKDRDDFAKHWEDIEGKKKWDDRSAFDRWQQSGVNRVVWNIQDVIKKD